MIRVYGISNMNFFSSTQTRPNIPTVNKDDCIRQSFQEHGTFYSPEIGHGVGIYEFDEHDYQIGQFNKSTDGTGFPVFVHGEYHHNGVRYCGAHVVHPENHCDFLNDTNGEIEWANGIRYNGVVELDQPVGTTGVYTIPADVTYVYNGHHGVLTHSNGVWSASFSTGHVTKVSGSSFTVRRMRFEGVVRIVYLDGCVFEGTEFQDDEKNNPGDVDKFTIPPKFTASNASSWSTHQLNLWLLSQPNLKFLPDRFYDNLHDYLINCRQLMKFNNQHFKKFGVNSIHGLIVQDTISQIGL